LDLQEPYDAWLFWGVQQNCLFNFPTNGLAFSNSAPGHNEKADSDNPAPDFYDYKGTFNATFQLTYQPGHSTLAISSLQTPAVATGNQHTFISSDTITLQGTLSPPTSGAAVQWTVTGQNAASTINGISETDNTDANGVSTFSFNPSKNATFVSFRQSHFATASKSPNDPLQFEVVARYQSSESRLSQTSVGTLLQDETDTLRQEYVDFKIPVPARSEIIPSLGRFNVGNYNVQLSVDLPGHYQAILSDYGGLPITVNGVASAIPAATDFIIHSAFRNPRRNLAAGSVHPNSRHVYGKAFDLSPPPAAVVITGQRVELSLHGVLYPALNQAASTQGTTLAEHGAAPVPLGNPTENHIHVQW
jgi:hypothetical protein